MGQIFTHLPRSLKMKETDTYISVHISNLENLPKEYINKLNHAIEIIQASEDKIISFQVISFSKELDQVQLLCCPDFWDNIFPGITESWILTFGDGGTRIVHEKYDILNPPILHHKEQYIKDTRSDIPVLREITRRCEEAGCFEQPVLNRQQWIRILNEKGIKF